MWIKFILNRYSAFAVSSRQHHFNQYIFNNNTTIYCRPAGRHRPSAVAVNHSGHDDARSNPQAVSASCPSYASCRRAVGQSALYADTQTASQLSLSLCEYTLRRHHRIPTVRLPFHPILPVPTCNWRHTSSGRAVLACTHPYCAGD